MIRNKPQILCKVRNYIAISATCLEEIMENIFTGAVCETRRNNVRGQLWFTLHIQNQPQYISAVTTASRLLI